MKSETDALPSTELTTPTGDPLEHMLSYNRTRVSENNS